MYKTNRLTDTESKLLVTKVETEEVGINQEYGINRYKLLYIKYISSKDLVYIYIYSISFNKLLTENNLKYIYTHI